MRGAGSKIVVLERWAVVLIAIHTFAVGCGLFFVPDWALRFGGWSVIPQPFFPRQAGIFHFVLGTGYLLEYFRHRTVTLLLTAKAFAFVFLLGATALARVPWFVTFAGVADGLMGVVAWALHRAAERETVGGVQPV